ncbi:MAG: hypothetical protein ACI4V5_04205, partial [Prevotella sp.]
MAFEGECIPNADLHLLSKLEHKFPTEVVRLLHAFEIPDFNPDTRFEPILVQSDCFSIFFNPLHFDDTVDVISDHLLDAVDLILLQVELMEDLILPAVPEREDFKLLKVLETLLLM